ncbi:hypothetical protein K440DRAFT_685043 [Wilcoxina mikolae CBS 423.85]|nr:hypothetical protein K440DRAFT_685043 [Wilcoxina mikolae CBS 423.85]
MSVHDIGWESLDIASDDETPQIVQYADNGSPMHPEGGTMVPSLHRRSTYPWPKLEATHDVVHEARERAATVSSQPKPSLYKKVSFDSLAHTRRFVPVAPSNESNSGSDSDTCPEYIKVDETSEISEPHEFEERLENLVDSAQYSCDNSYVDDYDDNRTSSITDKLRPRHRTQYADPADILNRDSIFMSHSAAIGSPEGSHYGQLRGIDTLDNSVAVDTYVEMILSRSSSLPGLLLRFITHEQYTEHPELARTPSPRADASLVAVEPIRPVPPRPTTPKSTENRSGSPAKDHGLDAECKRLSTPKPICKLLLRMPGQSNISAFDDPLYSPHDKFEQDVLWSHLTDPPTPTLAWRHFGPANNTRGRISTGSNASGQEANYDQPEISTPRGARHTDGFLHPPDNNFRFPAEQNRRSNSLSLHNDSPYPMERRGYSLIGNEIPRLSVSLGAFRRYSSGEYEPRERRWITRRVLERNSISGRLSIDRAILEDPETEVNPRTDAMPKIAVEAQLKSLKRRIATSFPAMANEASKASLPEVVATKDTYPPPEVSPPRQRNEGGNQGFCIIQTDVFKNTPVNLQYEVNKNQFVQMERIPERAMQVKTVLDRSYTTTENIMMRAQGVEIVEKGFPLSTANAATELTNNNTKNEQTEASNSATFTPLKKTSGKDPATPIKVQYGKAMVTAAMAAEDQPAISESKGKGKVEMNTPSTEDKPVISESKGKGKMKMNAPSTEDKGRPIGRNYRRTMGGLTAPISRKVDNVLCQDEKSRLSVQGNTAIFRRRDSSSDAEEPRFGLGYKEWAERKRLSGPIFVPSKEIVEAWKNNDELNEKYRKALEPTWVNTKKNKVSGAPVEEKVVIVQERRITWSQFFLLAMIVAGVDYYLRTGPTISEPATSVTEHATTYTVTTLDPQQPILEPQQLTEAIGEPTSTATSTTPTALAAVTGNCVGYIVAGSDEPIIMSDPNNRAECLEAVKFMEAEEAARGSK